MLKHNSLLQLIIIFASVMLMMISCRPSPLETALKLAGDNRAELEKVLHHYSLNEADSLKYRAACFLIENAAYHYTLAGKGVDEYRNYFDSVLCRENISWWDFVNAARDAPANFAGSYAEWDIFELTSDYLIAHIDSAFVTLQYPWTRNLHFDDFCEYVIPYRVGNEQLENWMDFYRNHHAATIGKSFPLGAGMYTVTNAMCDSLRRYYFVSNNFVSHNEASMKIELSPSHYIRAPGGTCPDMTKIALYSMRSMGLPVNYDYVIQWANRSQSHSWNSIMIDSVHHSFGMSDGNFDTHFDYRPEERLGKAYRKMFSFQPHSLAAQKGASKEAIPSIFRTPFIKDVSDLYFEGISVSVPLKYTIENKKRFAYLMVFDNRDWVPVAWGKIKKGCVGFEYIEKGCAYMVMYYHDGRFHPASDPFTITKEGEVVIRTPSNNANPADIKRKYPMFHRDFSLNRAKGGEFQISDYPDFRKYRTIHTIGELEDVRPYYLDIDNDTEFKHIRYMSSPGAHVFLAEIEFYNASGEKLNGKVIGTEGSYQNNGKDKYKVFDGNPLTVFDAPVSSGCWVGMAFDTLQTIGSLMFLPYNGDNFIQYEQDYELFYWNREFISLGRCKGDKTHVLIYDNVPDNALLLLKNHTKGDEERIFTYENGQQVWW